MALVVDAMPDLGVTRVSRWIFNCYVIHDGDGGAVVVDAGLPAVADDLAPILKRLSGRLQAIVATHGHSDHLGGAPELARRYGAPIYLPATTLTYLEGTRPRTPPLGDTARIWPTLIDQRLDPKAVVGLVTGTRVAGFGTVDGMRWTGPPPAGGLTDGQQLPGASAWTMVPAPGHTDDAIAFWNPKTGALLSGDAVLSAGGRAWHTPETVDTTSANSTRDRLQRLAVAHLLPGHGRPVHADTTVWEHQRR